MTVLYCHGFASSPGSAKAVDLQKRFAQRGISLGVPDLNQGDFAHLTLSRQIAQVEALLPSQPVTLIGSSLGAIVASWVAEKNGQVEKLVLLAPAFGFRQNWLTRLGAVTLQQWQQTGSLAVFHYGENRAIPLGYDFLTDAEFYPDEALQRPIPTLLLHGIRDETIPIAASREYAISRPWIRLKEFESDHALHDVMDPIWVEIQNFCGI